jgi:ABC-2 type transport system ATP-binding protein
LVNLTGVTKKFGSFTAVDKISYSIERGDYFALLGPNGAGKTTVVKMLLGFIKPTSGDITIDEKRVSDPLCRKSIGYLAEQVKIPPYLSGGEYLRRSAELIGLSGNELQRELDRVLDLVGMRGSERKKCGIYSKGMKQRMGLAAALLGSPKLLILDEPASGLDPIGIREVRKILETVNAAGVTIILNSHLLSEVEKTSSTVGIMYRGKILVKDTLQNIVKDNESLEDVFVRYIEGHHE